MASSYGYNGRMCGVCQQVKEEDMPSVVNQGIRIHYELEGIGPPLVMLSGLFGSVEDWYDFDYVNKLKDEYQLILIDHRGHGTSNKPHDSKKYSLKLSIDDIRAVLDELNIEQCHFYGFSMGAWFIFGLAKYYSEMLLSIIIADGFPSLMAPNNLRIVLDSFDEIIEKRAEIKSSHKQRYLANDREALEAIADWRERENQMIINLVNEVVKEIRVPALVLTGNLKAERDKKIIVDKAASYISDFELVKFESLSHVEILTRSDLTLPKIKSFLARVCNI